MWCASCFLGCLGFYCDIFQGKRSISDHMNEAVNYIRHMQNNIKELGAKRDELKKVSSNSNMENSHEGFHTSCNFSVHENNGVIGIEITSGFREEKPKVSKLLQLLIQEGLEVVSCLSSEVNGRLFHSVQCEVRSSWFVFNLILKIYSNMLCILHIFHDFQVKNSNCVDLSELRRKVSKAFPAFRCTD